MKIILTAIDSHLITAWKHFCGDLDYVEIHRGSIVNLKCDAIVSPANSFGFMDGGVDATYSAHFGWHVQHRLQELIRERHFGELIVGSAEIIETGGFNIPFIIAAPTMRVPMILKDSVNPYLAARATLLLIKNGVFSSGVFEGKLISDVVKSVAFPGLGTGVGRVSSATCARQVRSAIDDVLGQTSFPESWYDAQTRHQELYTYCIRDLQQNPPYPSNVGMTIQ